MSYLAKKWAERRANPTPRAKRIERQIMIMTAFFSISIGLWENFRQLWLESNDYTATEVSNILSLGMAVGVLGIMVVGKCVRMHRIRNLMTVTLMARFLDMMAYFCLNQIGNRMAINICVIFDVLSSYIIIMSIYPLLTTVTKSNNAYSRRKLVEYLFRDVGVMVGGALIGYHVGQWLFDFNGCLLVSAVFLVIATLIMYQLKPSSTERPQSSTRFSALRMLRVNKIQRVYTVYNFLSSVSYMTVVGLKMLVFTNMLELSVSAATNTALVVGLSADLIGILALRFFTPKNDYVTMTIKFGIRLVAMAVAAITDSPFLCFVAFIWILLSQTSYENISDGYYINMIDNRFQLQFGTFRNVISYSGEAVGMFLCGQLYNFGLPVMLGVASLILFVQLIFVYYLIYVREHNAKQMNSHNFGRRKKLPFWR